MIMDKTLLMLISLSWLCLIFMFLWLEEKEERKYFETSFKICKQENSYIKELMQLETNTSFKNKTTID